MMLSYKEMLKWFVCALLVIATLGIFVFMCGWLVSISNISDAIPEVKCGEYYQWKYDKHQVPARCYKEYNKS